MTAVLLISVAMAIAVAAWAVCKRAGQLDAEAGKGNAPASGSPSQGDWPAVTPHTLSDERVRQVLGDAFDRHYAAAVDSLRHAGRCGAPGPGGMVCDLPPHEGLQHTPVSKRPTTLDGFR